MSLQPRLERATRRLLLIALAILVGVLAIQGEGGLGAAPAARQSRAEASRPAVSNPAPTATPAPSPPQDTSTSALGGSNESSSAPPSRIVSLASGAQTGPASATNASSASEEADDVGTISVSGDHLTLNGQVHDFVGVNAYEIGTEWGTNAGCGGMETDAQLDQLFSALPHDSLVRFWAFQGSIATNKTTGQIDWGPLDRVFDIAAQYDQKLIVVLTDQGGTCDNPQWQDRAWYGGGFMNAYDNAWTTDGKNLTPLSYWDYLQLVVTRYRNSPALGMWEPVSEPEASTCPTADEPLNCSGNQTCPDEGAAAQSLRYFFDTVGGEIHTLDPNHLVESGMLGGGQCGSSGSDFEYVSASPGIDVLSYHDYYGAAEMGGDQWNGIAVRISQAAALGKPIIAGEVGIEAGSAPGCTSLGQRSTELLQKIGAQLAAGTSAVLLWDWYPAPTSSCDYTVFPGDPTLQALGTVTPPIGSPG